MGLESAGGLHEGRAGGIAEIENVTKSQQWVIFPGLKMGVILSNPWINWTFCLVVLSYDIMHIRVLSKKKQI